MLNNFFAKFKCAALAALSLTACANIDMNYKSSFYPVSETTFRYSNIANVIYPEDDPEAEALRIERLVKYLEANSMCAEGYMISARKPVVELETFHGNVYMIHYEGECSPTNQ